MAATVGLPSLDLYLLSQLFLAVLQLVGLNTFQSIGHNKNYHNTSSTKLKLPTRLLNTKGFIEWGEEGGHCPT